MNALFNLGREGFLTGEIDYDTAVVKVAPVEGYTFDAAHEFVSDVTGAGGTLLGTPQALTGKTTTSGTAGAANCTFTGTLNSGTLASGHTIGGFLVYQSSAVTGGADVADTAQRVIGWFDGVDQLTCSVAASTSDTTVHVDPIPNDLASGSTVVFGAVTATLTVPATAGDRTLTVSALSGGISVGTTGLTSAQGGMPLTTNGGDVTLVFPGWTL
jgi:hypothetical protein